MEALLQVEAVSNSQYMKALRFLFDNISSNVRSLVWLKETWNPCLSSL